MSNLLRLARHSLPIALVLLLGCDAPNPLTDGASWVSREIPPSLAGTVARYERVETFGAENDPHGWRLLVRTTLRADAPTNPGCSFTEWIAGTWTTTDSTLTITTPSTGSGSREMHDCPDRRDPTTVAATAAFDHASSSYRLEGRTLRVDRRFGETPRTPVVLRRAN